jgi:signal transduction histidine kinase
MKLTKQLETEIIEAYDSFWVSNLSANMELFASYLLDDFSIFGSANGETFFSREDAVAFYTATAGQLKDKAQLRNRHKTVQPLEENSAIVLELSDLYVLAGDTWIFYGHARITCVLKKINNEWKAQHQHASFPDYRTEEGQQLATEKIEQENLELREAVKRRTVELEAKNRELEIEAAVERVRAQSMAMQQTSDIAKVNEELFTQISKLNIDGFTGVAIYLVGEDEIVTVWDLSSPGSMGDLNSHAFKFDPQKTPTLSEFIPIWRAGKVEYFIMDYAKERLLTAVVELEPFYPVMAASFRAAIASGALEHQWNATATIANGVLSLDMMKPPTEEVKVITLKMAAAFSFAYQRFHDLQHAEQQTREAQVEAALERIRSRTMGMQKSEELKEVIQVVYDQFVLLKIPIEHTGFVLDYKNRNDYHIWIADNLGTPANITIPYFSAVYYDRFNDAKKNGIDFFAANLTEEEKNRFYHDLFQHLPGFPDTSKEFIIKQPALTISTVLLDKIALYIENFSGIPYTEEENSVLMRLGKVFEQTYTRFLDLQKAEEQTRYAQIELAVERVRAKALAMHNSKQIGDVVETLRHEMLALEIPGVVAATIYLQEEEGYIRMWDLSSVVQMGEGFHVSLDIKFKLEETDPGLFIRRVWYNKDNYFVEKQEPHDMAITLVWLRQYYPNQADEVQQFLDATGWDYLLHPTIQLAHGKMSVDIFNRAPPDEMESIMVKMGAAFDLAYKRFVDLQKSEQQIREAQIELALERVRAKTMAMQYSNELADTASVLFQQIKRLGFQTWSCGFFTWQKDEMVEAWMGADSGGLLPPMHLPYKEDLTHHDVYNASVNGVIAHHKIWEGEALQQHYDFLRTIPSVKEAIDILEASGLSMPDKQCYYVGFFEQGYLLLITKEPDNDLKELSKRFAKVFEQTYTRFLDLQKAEAQTREAQIEIALERVRSRTMAMQHSDELADASFVLDSQVRALGIQTRGCAFNIYGENESTEWFSSEAGMLPPYKTPREDFFERAYDAGQSGQPMYIEEFAGDDCKAHYEYLSTIPIMGDALNGMIEAGLSFPERQIDHATFFKYGYLLFITLEPVPDAEEVFIRFAKVFEQTYTRFLDLQKAEAQAVRAEQDLIEIKEARKKAEDTLVELQLTQKQLIQSEKMASLGELTAGIAHEIQNPLNFVNNFSDVSSELFDEMNIELVNGDMEEVKAIAAAIKSNLEKINHHGKRADAIVKGMLQHSRKSEGQKEPADINALCDEYLRLSYHGLRAKDKSFNATLKTDLDENLGKINIIPQDMGRVIMNLLTNAFYAVDERAKTAAKGYKPAVSIQTKKTANHIEITVLDNGNGIPAAVKEKIFQPFFTTKPTGKGTGLGLSLSYDIVKTHGGELKVESIEGEFTRFVITLPV